MSAPGSTVAPLVIKVGGREIAPGPALDRLVGLVARLLATGRAPVIVHGGGEEVTDRAEALGLASTRARGQRITSAPMLEVVVEVLAGRINTRLVAAMGRRGVRATGLTGADRGLIAVRPAGDPPGTLGFVGQPTAVHPAGLRALLAERIVPIVAPIGVDRAGQLYNVNADGAAAAIAAALRAELWIITDVDGVRGPDGRVAAVLATGEVAPLIASGVASDGMLPKLESAVTALRDGARSAWIGPLDELAVDGPRRGAGTWLRPNPPPTRRRLPLLAASLAKRKVS